MVKKINLISRSRCCIKYCEVKINRKIVMPHHPHENTIVVCIVNKVEVQNMNKTLS